MNIVVRRGAGTSPMEDLVDPLLSDLNAALHKGRNLLDEHSGLRPFTTKVVFSPGYRKGNLVKVINSLTGKSIIGIIEDIDHVLSSSEGATTLTLLVSDATVR